MSTLARVNGTAGRAPENGSRRRPLAVFVLIDALGWAYLKDRDFLPETLTHRREVQTVLGFSSGAIPVLLSGLQPRETGHWNLFFYDPANSPFGWVRYFTFLPPWVLNNRIVRRGVRFISQRVSRFGGYFQIYGVPVELLPCFDICEKEDIYRPRGVPASIFDRLEESGVRYRSYSYHEFSDQEIIEEARKDLRKGKHDFHFVYLSEFDAFLHDWCKDEQRVEGEIRRYEGWLRQLYADAQATNGDVGFFILSDHGMTPKLAGFDLLGEVKALEFQMPRDFLALYDSTMARFWFFNEQARERIVGRLRELDCGHFLTDTEKREFGLDFTDNRFGDEIFLMNPGVLIEPSFMGARGPEGMHGFHPVRDPFSSAVFLGNRDPGRPMQTLVDVNAVMREWIEAVASSNIVKK